MKCGKATTSNCGVEKKQQQKTRLIREYVEEAAARLLSAQMLFSLVLISSALFLLVSSLLRSATVHSRSCETIRPIKRCLPAIKIVCSPQWERKWGEWKGKINNFWRQILNCFYCILTLISLKCSEQSTGDMTAPTGIYKVDGKTSPQHLNVCHGPLSGRSATQILYPLFDN